MFYFGIPFAVFTGYAATALRFQAFDSHLELSNARQVDVGFPYVFTIPLICMFRCLDPGGAENSAVAVGCYLPVGFA